MIGIEPVELVLRLLGAVNNAVKGNKKFKLAMKSLPALLERSAETLKTLKSIDEKLLDTLVVKHFCEEVSEMVAKLNKWKEQSGSAQKLTKVKVALRAPSRLSILEDWIASVRSYMNELSELLAMQRSFSDQKQLKVLESIKHGLKEMQLSLDDVIENPEARKVWNQVAGGTNQVDVGKFRNWLKHEVGGVSDGTFFLLKELLDNAGRGYVTVFAFNRATREKGFTQLLADLDRQELPKETHTGTMRLQRAMLSQSQMSPGPSSAPLSSPEDTARAVVDERLRQLARQRATMRLLPATRGAARKPLSVSGVDLSELQRVLDQVDSVPDRDCISCGKLAEPVTQCSQCNRQMCRNHVCSRFVRPKTLGETEKRWICTSCIATIKAKK